MTGKFEHLSSMVQQEGIGAGFPAPTEDDYTKNPTPIARGPAWTTMAGGNS